MELCDTCKKTLCEKNMEITRQGNLITIRCRDYEKDTSKIQGYKKPLQRTAKQGHRARKCSSVLTRKNV